MNIITIDRSTMAQWIAYAKRYRERLDDSYLSDEELDRLAPTASNPLFALTDARGIVRGAAAFVDEAYLMSAKKARFRIFHAESADPGHYEALWNAAAPAASEAESVFLFVREEERAMRTAIEALGFGIERIAYVLTRETGAAIPEPSFPDGTTLRAFEFGRDEAAWCDVRNSGFARLKGSEAPMSPEHVAEMRTWEEHLEGGMFLLYDGEEAVGCVRVGRTMYNDKPCAEIGPLALKPSHQGRGLGRALLRAAIRFGKDRGFETISLSVNAENESAVSLYIKEGFRKELAFVCYART